MNISITKKGFEKLFSVIQNNFGSFILVVVKGNFSNPI